MSTYLKRHFGFAGNSLCCFAMIVVATTFASFDTQICVAQAESQETTEAKSDEADAKQKQYEKFEEMLSGVKLIGSFTVRGQDLSKLRTEEYTIAKVEKLRVGELWKFNARIKYGDNDYTVPLTLTVEWAGDTPMITLTDFSILGQGPFSARVLFYDGQYAGTWAHGDVGGHMFGKIEKLEAEGDKPESDSGDGE